MTSFTGLGIGLSLVFGFLLLALVAELYYVLWWKKRINHRGEVGDDYDNYAKEYLIQLFRWKKPSSLRISKSQDCERGGGGQVSADVHGVVPDKELGTSKDLLLKSFGDESEVSQLMRLHNLAGPPRFLFTIKEETKEDLESNDGKSRVDDRSGTRSRAGSVSDLMVTLDSPFLTPLASPRIKSPTLDAFDSYHRHGLNPLFESSTESEVNRLRPSSPPPKFKFLRDAEEKLSRRLMVEEAGKRVSKDLATEVREGSFLKFIVGRHHLQQFPSSTSQVIPLAHSPTKFRPVLHQKPRLH